MNRNSIGPLRPMILVFVLLNGFFVAGRAILEKWNVDQSVVIGGNLILFIVSLASFLLTKRSLAAPNPNAFVRAMYGSFMIKFFVCAAAAFAYIMSVKKNVNKQALFVCMGLYIVYTVLEVSSLLKLLKQKKNA
ncbi:MAG: hypothetical protein JNK14_18000 [Chitinophagaceae bacterium]|nr:hypothetical protein [Chitinophagaceae bacterium]